MGTFESHAIAAFEGRETFDSFAQATQVRWNRLARMILRRWRQPSWVTLDDVTQDLLFGAWQSIGKWDASRTPRIEIFLVWSAVVQAKRKAHKARGANMHRKTDSDLGRIEKPFSSLAEGATENIMKTSPDQEDASGRSMLLRKARKECRTEVEVVVIDALSEEPSISHAAERLMGSSDVRQAYRLGTSRKAELLAARTASAVAGRVWGIEEGVGA